MSGIRNNYPFATRENTAVPTAILKPLRFIKALASSSVTFLEGEEVVQCEAVGGSALLVFAAIPPVLADNIPIEDAMYLPWGARIAVAIPADKSMVAHIISLAPGTTHVFLQTVESWKAIDNQSALRKQF